MPSTISLAQNDVFQLNGTVISTFATGDCCKVTSPNNLIETDVGKNLGGLLAYNAKGLIADAELDVIMGGIDDQNFNALLGEQMAQKLVPMTASLSKAFVDGHGNQIIVVYDLFGGGILKAPEEMVSATGNIAQLVAVWKFQFTNWDRNIAS